MLPDGLALGGWTNNIKINVLRQLEKFGLAEWQRTAAGPFAGRARITPDGVYDIEGSQVVIPPIEIADPAMPQAHPTHTLLVWLAFIAGIVFAVIGVVLVYLGATGDTQIDLWGAKISTSSVGIAAIFIAAILIVRTFRRVLDSVDNREADAD
jgi:hypothetical protein